MPLTQLHKMEYTTIDPVETTEFSVRHKVPRNSSCPNSTIRLSALFAFALIVACIITYFATKAAYDQPNNSAYNRNNPFHVPAVYEAYAKFHIPYISFVEDVHVHVDSVHGRQKLSYFSGMDTYVFDINGWSWKVVPVMNQLACLKENQTDSLQNVFPQLEYFSLAKKRERVVNNQYPHGVVCDVWTFAYDKVTKDEEGDATAILPNDDGYSGEYNFYVSSNDGSPVQFVADIGHNVVLGGSHSDHYVLEYVSFKPVDSLPDFHFQPPSGMPCTNGITPFGPTAHRSSPLTDFRKLFPEGAAHRAAEFEAFVSKYGKSYSAKEKRMRMSLFHTNLHYINAVNRLGKSYVLAANHMTDWTMEEKRALGGYKLKSSLTEFNDSCPIYSYPQRSLPDRVDWRGVSQGGLQPEPGFVLPPKDQGTCGSCWTYGTTGAIEAAVYNKTGKLIPLSEQNLMDCTWEYNNNACDGGTDYLAYAWMLQQNQGKIATDASYGGYLNQNGFCHYSLSDGWTKNPWTGKEVEAGATMASCWHVNKQYQNDSVKVITDAEAVDSLLNALAFVGPISVAIDATQPDFYYYHAGYYYNHNCGNLPIELDHIVFAVGYETDSQGNKYFLIRNSWSEHWGDKGFAKIAVKDNNCGVATAPTFVFVQ